MTLHDPPSTGKMMLNEVPAEEMDTRTSLYLPSPSLFPGVRLILSFLKNPFTNKPERSLRKKGRIGKVALEELAATMRILTQTVIKNSC